MTASDELRLGGDHNRQINYRKKNNNNKTKQNKKITYGTDIEHIQKTKRSITDNKLAKLIIHKTTIFKSSPGRSFLSISLFVSLFYASFLVI